ncbi:hypothetical protein LUZ60_004887 [Juncus effusus]|nr:hypothetical protein LUZ60_004887 [Juncus effusus]
MPSKVMDQRHFSPSFFSEEVRFPVERQVGFWKHDAMPDQREAFSKSVSSSPIEKLQLQPIGVNIRDQKAKFAMEERENFLARERAASLSSSANSPWRSLAELDALKLPANVSGSLFGSEMGRVDMNGTRYENGLFSSSFSDILDKKMRSGGSSRSSMLFPRPTPPNPPLPTRHANSHAEIDEPFFLTQEIEHHTIGDLLPDDDDLLSGVLDEISALNIAGANAAGDDLEDDIFFTGGGMELEGEGEADKVVNGAGPFVGEHPFGEHPSRTLFVRNINSNVEDTELRLLFEQYGDIRTLYTACKHRGFVMISYYDIRSARNAMRSLQNKPLRRRKLDIHYSIPKDNPTDKDVNQGTLVVFNLDSNVTNDDLHQIFGVYGEIKEIRETPQKSNHKFIEYFDVRAAETALRALNRSDIAGKKIKLEPSRPGGTTRRLLPQLGSEMDQDEINGVKVGSPSNSPIFGSIPLENGSLHSAIRAASISPFMESKFPSLSSSSLSQTLSTPIGIMSSLNPQNGSTNHNGTPGGQSDLSHSLGQSQNSLGQSQLNNFNFNFHPHSLPEYHHNNGAGNNSLPYNLSAMSAMGINVNSRVGEGLDARHLQKVGSAGLNGLSFDRNETGFGTGSCPLHGLQQQQQQQQSAHQLLWNSSNPNNPTNLTNSFPHPLHAHQHSVPTPSPLWSNSAANSLLSSLPPVHHHLLPPLSHHHPVVGSAPSIWDRSPPPHQPPQSFFHPLDALSMMSSPAQQRGGGSMFNNMVRNNPMVVGVPPGGGIVPEGSGGERGMRGRRSDVAAGQGDNKKQYELDVDKIMRGDDSRTTLMIKNIPNKYTSKMLLAAIDENHRGTYDFIYLPIDFKNKCNVGYAFINMINPQHIVPFYQTFNGKKWEKFNSEKVASLAYARIQGKGALIAHFQNSSLMNEDKRCRPILFHSDGPNAGDQEPFPMGSNIRSRSGRNRSIGNEENSQESLIGTATNLSSDPFDPISAASLDSSE